VFKSGSETGQKRVKYNVQSCGRHSNFRMKNEFRNLEKEPKARVLRFQTYVGQLKVAQAQFIKRPRAFQAMKEDIA
jgi:hypothetical protein